MKKKYPNLHQDDPQYAFNQAARYLSLRARSKKEIEDYLLKKGFEPLAISRAVERLIDLKVLNDKEYGESFTRSRQVYKGKSRYFVKYELQQKGLTSDVIDKVITNSQEDLETAKAFIKRKKRVFSYLDQKEFKEKMMRLLASRGFSYDVIKKAIADEQ